MEMCPKVVHVSRDKIRFSLLNEGEDYFARENLVFKEWVKEIQEHINLGHDVIADATHLTPASRKKLLNSLNLNEVPVTAINFIASLDKCLERNEKRKGRAYVPKEVIKRMYHSYKPAKMGEDPRITGVWNLEVDA